MAGNRWKVEPQLYYPSVETGQDYFWTNCFYYENLSSDPFSGDYYSAIIEAVHAGTLDTVNRPAVRVTNTTTGHVHSIVTIPWVGAIPADGEAGSLTNTLRLVAWGGGRQVGYKLWRVPLRLSDFEGGQLTPTLAGVIADGLLTWLNSVQLCSEVGNPIDEWTCDNVLHSWQLRHGTKRRIGPVFAYP